MAKVKETKLSELIPDDLNANKHSEYGMHLLEKSIAQNGLGRSILIDKNNKIIGGNGVTETASNLNLEDVIIVETDGTQLVAVKRTDVDINSKVGRELAIADNSVAHVNLQWDEEALTSIQEQWDVNPEEWGIKDFEEVDVNANEQQEASKSLNEKFIVPPFSILDTRKDYWQKRKTMWRHIIGDYGESRNDTLIQSLELKYKDIYEKSMTKRKKLGITFREYLEKYVSEEEKEKADRTVLSQGVSILDPVLAEIIVHWFGLENGKAFDPFAGDTVFGFVSSKMGQDFTGIELRDEQCSLNNQRVKEAGIKAKYINDDGQNVSKHIEPNSHDLLFSCPPYFNLEKYSDLDNDASNQKSYDDFMNIIRNAFTAAIKCLKENRFAVVVVGDVRDKQGFYYRFHDDVKDVFKANGMKLYNEIILIETGASTALRASRTMERRKVAKMHQNVLVFYNGDIAKIKDIFPKIEYKEDFEDESENLEY